MALSVRDADGNKITMATTVIDGEHVTHNLREWQGPRPITLYRYLDTVGNGTGVKAATGDYTPAGSLGSGDDGFTEFMIKPANNEIFRIYALMAHVRATNCNSSLQYGNLTALSNGVEIAVKTSTTGATILDLTDGVPIRANADWARFAGIDIVQGVYSTGDEYLSILTRFDLADAPLRLQGTANEYLTVRLGDDFSGLTDHRFFAYGYNEEQQT